MRVFQIARGQQLQFTGMGGPMGVYDDYDTVRDNEGNYGGVAGASGLQVCPKAFDCNGIPPEYWHPSDSMNDGFW